MEILYMYKKPYTFSLSIGMPKRLPFNENSYYHVYNRWLDKKTIFHDQKDFQRFVWYIHMYQEKCTNDIMLIAYCILPNHFHFVIHNKQAWHQLSYFVGNICASYTRYYKAKYGSDTGQLFFESRFKSKQLTDEHYLQQCIYYVEHNPLKHQLVDRIDQRLWRSESSVSGWLDVLSMDWEF